MNKKPKGAQFEHEGLYYKKGVHNMIFFWASDRWQRSSKNWSEITGGDRV